MTEEFPLVLIVDDMAETRRLMRRVLERDRFRVVEAASGEDALRMIRSSRPQLVILDLRLPQMSGFDVARELRSYEDPDLAGIPLIACSASVQPEVRQEALDAGCDAFEGKPIDVPTFAARAREVMAQNSRR